MMKIPTGEPLRYLLAGGFNTTFGVANTFAATWIFVHLAPAFPALMTSTATAVSTILNIAVSFCTYKLFVFRTKGNWISEYLRSLLVYLPTLLVGTAAIAPLTAAFRHLLSRPAYAPYIAQACLVTFSVVTSFLGHKHVTFKKEKQISPVEITETN